MDNRGRDQAERWRVPRFQPAFGESLGAISGINLDQATESQQFSIRDAGCNQRLFFSDYGAQNGYSLDLAQPPQ